MFCRYYQLDTSQTLKECLANKTITEFPTLHVVLPDKIASYPTSHQDETSIADKNVTESFKPQENSACVSSFTSVSPQEPCVQTGQNT